MKNMDLVTGIVVTWDDATQAKGSAIIDAEAEGEKIRLIYDPATHLIDNVVSGDVAFSKEVCKGIEDTSGTWRDERKRTATPGSKKATVSSKKRKYTPRVYFWTRVLADGTKVYCHSRKLCDNDPMGAELYAQWIADPQDYMAKYPLLSR